MTSAVPTPDVANPATLARNMTIATPFLLLVPVAFAAAFLLSGIDLRWLAVGAGAVGWLVALVLRGPVSLVAVKASGSPDGARPWVVASSGPLEEGVRVATLLIIGRSLDDAVSVGLGWAAIEVVYTIISGFLIVNLIRRDDPEARQARELLEAQGMLRATGPALGVLERVGATALHIGFTLIVAWRLPMAILTAVLHSAVNLSIERTFRRFPVASEVALLAAGAAALATGFFLLG